MEQEAPEERFDSNGKEGKPSGIFTASLPMNKESYDQEFMQNYHPSPACSLNQFNSAFMANMNRLSPLYFEAGLTPIDHLFQLVNSVDGSALRKMLFNSICFDNNVTTDSFLQVPNEASSSKNWKRIFITNKTTPDNAKKAKKESGDSMINPDAELDSKAEAGKTQPRQSP